MQDMKLDEIVGNVDSGRDNVFEYLDEVKKNWAYNSIVHTYSIGQAVQIRNDKETVNQIQELLGETTAKSVG